MGARALLAGHDGIRLEGVVTAEDLDRALDAMASRMLERDEQFIDFAGGVTDSDGNIDLTLTEVPPGKEANIVMVVVEAAGFTIAVPFSSAGSWVSLHRGLPPAGLVGFTPSSQPLLPAIISYGADAPLLRSAQSLIVHVEDGPASTQITASVQGVLRPTVVP